MNERRMYTQEQLDIELIKHEQTKIFDILEKIDKSINGLYGRIEVTDSRVETKIESATRWILGLVFSGFAAMFSIMAHGFHWL